MDTYRQAVEGQLKRLTIDTTYSYKGHFIAAEKYQKRYQLLAAACAVLSFLSSGLIFSSLASLAWMPITTQSTFQLAGIITAVLSGITAVLLTQLGYGEATAQHQIAANDYLTLSRECRTQLMKMSNPRTSTDAAALCTEELAARASSIARVGRKIPQWAYEAAKKAIEKGEVDYSESDYRNIIGTEPQKPFENWTYHGFAW